MSLKPGTLVKYRPRAGAARIARTDQSASAEDLVTIHRAAHHRAAAYCYWDLNLTWNEIEAKLIGIVLKNFENNRLQVRWFGINKAFDWEYEEYLEIVKEI